MCLPDVMTNGQHMLWIMDEFEAIAGGRYPGVITGKPIGMGGSLGRKEATGYGVIYVLREALKAILIYPKQRQATLWQCGRVCRKAVFLMGGRIIALSTWTSMIKAYTFRKRRPGYW